MGFHIPLRPEKYCLNPTDINIRAIIAGKVAGGILASLKLKVCFYLQFFTPYK